MKLTLGAIYNSGGYYTEGIPLCAGTVYGLQSAGNSQVFHRYTVVMSLAVKDLEINKCSGNL
jgi:hypothetical protein